MMAENKYGRLTMLRLKYIHGEVTFFERIFAYMWLIYRYLRVQKPISWLWGPMDRLHPYRIELDITYRCNVKCVACNRLVHQAPTGKEMNAEQIKKFVTESVEKRKHWDIIAILGGEPTLHPDFLNIMYILCEYKKVHAPQVSLVLFTNGCNEKRLSRLLDDLPDIKVVNSDKNEREPLYHIDFQRTPGEDPLYAFADFRLGCSMIERCGTTLTPYGYYPCPLAGSIDRVFGFDCGRKVLPEEGDRMTDVLEKICPFCGFFDYFSYLKRAKPFEGVADEPCSKKWADGYAQYRKEPPHLSLY